MVMKVGEKAQDFELPDQNMKMRKLSEFFGKKIILAFFPGAFTSVCTKELCTFRDSMANFNRFNANVIGISVDSPFCLASFAKENRLNFTLLSDVKKEISKNYCGLHDNFGKIPGFQVSKRAVFIIDEKGVIRYSWISEDPGKEPNYREIEEELAKL